VPKLKTAFAATADVDMVYTNEEARALGIPSTADSDQAPDLFLTAREGYVFDDRLDGPLVADTPLHGQHGYANTDPNMQALFVASGAHIRSGVALGVISNLRVAPSIAKILNVTSPAAKRSPLNEILK
jgi:hypothetical protein